MAFQCVCSWAKEWSWWGLWEEVSYRLFWVLRTDCFCVFSVASWFPFICNTEHLGEIPHSLSQNYWLIHTFSSPPELSDSSVWYSSLLGAWCKCLKVTGVRTGIWSFAIKQRGIFLHFWQKCWLLTSGHISCIVFYPAFALHYPLAAFRASVCQSALSSCALWSWALSPTVLSSWHSALSLHLGYIPSLQQRPCKSEDCGVIVAFTDAVLMFQGIKKHWQLK